MLQAFTLFPLLPTELRLKVWHHAQRFFSRIIEVRPQLLSHDTPVEFRQWDAMASSIIPLLQVNREARYELLPRYFAPFSPRRVCPYYPTSLLINYEIDTLYYRVSIMSHFPKDKLFEHVFEDAVGEVRDNLRRFAGNQTFWTNFMSTQPTSNVVPSLGFLEFESFTKLEEITVVPSVEQLLDGSTRLERLEECVARAPYEAEYPPWFGKGFNLTSRSVPRSIKLCREVGKLELDSSL